MVVMVCVERLSYVRMSPPVQQTIRIEHRLIGMGVCEKHQADSLADNAPEKNPAAVLEN